MNHPTAKPTKHRPAYFPSSGTGYQCCACGATRHVRANIPTESWHTCVLCTHLWYHQQASGRRSKKSTRRES